MKKILFSLVAVSFLAGGLSAIAQDSNLPSAGITPDSPFYIFKTLKENIQVFFTFNAEQKARQYLHLADVRLAEYQKMLDKGKTNIAQKTLDKYQKQLNRAISKVEELKTKGRDVKDISDRIASTTAKHINILESNLQKVPEAAKEGLERALENAKKIKPHFYPGKIISLIGTFIPDGAECGQFKTDDGLVYSLQSNGNIFEGFKDGDEVSIKAELMEVSYCMQGDTLRLLEINHVERTEPLIKFDETASDIFFISPQGEEQWKVRENHTIEIKKPIDEFYPFSHLTLNKSNGEEVGIISCKIGGTGKTVFTWEAKSVINYCGAGLDNKVKEIEPGTYVIAVTKDVEGRPILAISKQFSIIAN